MNNERQASRKTIIYLLVSLLTVAFGAVLILSGLAGGDETVDRLDVLFALGTSMAAGGLSALALGVLRVVDDRDSDGTKAELERIRDQIRTDGSTTRTLVARTVRVDASAALRCVSDLAIGEQFQDAYLVAAQASSPPKTPVEVDVMGLKLHRFLQDQLTWMLAQKAATDVRLLLQRPGTDVFNAICHIEGRAPNTAASELRETLDMLSGGTVTGLDYVWKSGRVRIRVRYYDQYQPVTLFRVGGQVMARPRVATPRGAATRFYESYRLDDSPNQHSVYRAHFDWCWSDSAYEEPQ